MTPRVPVNAIPKANASGTLLLWRLLGPNSNYRDSTSYKFEIGSELFIEHVSPGKYGYYVGFPGTQIEDDAFFEVTDKPVTISPQLRPATVLIVPLLWKDGKPPRIPSEDWSWSERQSVFVTILRDGERAKYRRLSTEAARPHFGKNAVFEGLAPGTYEIGTAKRPLYAVDSRDELIHLRPVPAKITVTIPPDSAPVITTPPLPVAFEVLPNR